MERRRETEREVCVDMKGKRKKVCQWKGFFSDLCLKQTFAR